jgi:hypothetical protein
MVSLHHDCNRMGTRMIDKGFGLGGNFIDLVWGEIWLGLV